MAQIRAGIFAFRHEYNKPETIGHPFPESSDGDAKSCSKKSGRPILKAYVPISCKQPKKDHCRIRSSKERPRHAKRGEDERRCRQPSVGVAHLSDNRANDKRRRNGQKTRDEADAERSGAEERRSHGDLPSDARRFAIVADVRKEAPRPVLGLIWHEADA